MKNHGVGRNITSKFQLLRSDSNQLNSGLNGHFEPSSNSFFFVSLLLSSFVSSVDFFDLREKLNLPSIEKETMIY